MSVKEPLEKRVMDFQLMRLPGQPVGVHLGTSYLVQDLWDRVCMLEALLRKAKPCVEICSGGPSERLNPAQEILAKINEILL